jgi:predicted RNase H-like HicB family nuclease
MPKQYDVIYHQGPTSWGAWVPDLPIVFGAAKTLKQTQRLMRQAIALHIEWLRQDGDPVPPPDHRRRGFVRRPVGRWGKR